MGYPWVTPRFKNRALMLAKSTDRVILKCDCVPDNMQRCANDFGNLHMCESGNETIYTGKYGR